MSGQLTSLPASGRAGGSFKHIWLVSVLCSLLQFYFKMQLKHLTAEVHGSYWALLLTWNQNQRQVWRLGAQTRF